MQTVLFWIPTSTLQMKKAVKCSTRQGLARNLSKQSIVFSTGAWKDVDSRTSLKKDVNVMLPMGWEIL